MPSTHPHYIRYRDVIDIAVSLGHSAMTARVLASEESGNLQRYYLGAKPVENQRALYKTTEVYALFQPQPVPSGK